MTLKFRQVSSSLAHLLDEPFDTWSIVPGDPVKLHDVEERHMEAFYNHRDIFGSLGIGHDEEGDEHRHYTNLPHELVEKA
jgi:hypothetical protein